MTDGQRQPEHPARAWPFPEVLAQLRPAPPVYRASDMDREHVTQLLGRAVGTGQIDIHEFERRTKAVYAAKTHVELEAVIRDLSVHSLGAPLAVVPGSGPKLVTLFGVFGGFRRRGPWVVPQTLNVFVFFGGGFLDLREASFVCPDARINVWSLFGRTKVIVPHELDLRVEGIEMIGEFEDKASGPGTRAPGECERPKIVVNGLSVLSGVHVERPYGKGKAILKRILKYGR
ncbi:MAG: DUF1707 SHOCT-like domain-containing protein [Segniliparus sp.]|uniref:DUF1707 SHOCT-like domain-containing protein n=1 Tax=Segniliparus sp. TaxID=2804064 RepID=UPI003F371B78